MDHTTAAVAGAVRAALAERKIEDATVASWLGVSRSTASRKKNGHMPFSLTDLRIIADALDLDSLSLYPQVVLAPKRSAYAEQHSA